METLKRAYNVLPTKWLYDNISSSTTETRFENTESTDFSKKKENK